MADAGNPSRAQGGRRLWIPCLIGLGIVGVGVLLWSRRPAFRHQDDAVRSQEASSASGGGSFSRLTDVASALGLATSIPAGTPEKILIVESIGSGCAIVDLNLDERPDVLLGGGGRIQDGRAVGGLGLLVYLQLADGRLEEVSRRLGLVGDGWVTGLAIGDIENDGDPDVFVGTLGEPLLFRNDRPTDASGAEPRFVECGRASGLSQPGFASSAVFLDFDRDGVLDLFVGRYVQFDPAAPPFLGQPCREKGVPVACGPTLHEPASPLLYRGVGNGRFEDVTERARLRARPAAYTLGAQAGDLDGDGWPDLYLANDTQANHLWRNRGDGTFEEVALEAGCALSESGQGQAGMGVDLADINDDGRLDIFVSNYSEEWNALYVNLGSLSFADRIHDSGLSAGSYLALGWGARFVDMDNDGWLDLLVAGGHVHPAIASTNPALSYLQPLLIYRGRSAHRFERLTGQAGPDVDRPRAHRAVAAGDFDGDGDVDFVISVLDTPSVLLRNHAPSNHRSLRISLVGSRSNREGIGARVQLVSGGRTQTREISRCGGYLSASEPVAHFGLGVETTIEQVRVLWPSGQTDQLRGIQAGFWYRVAEGGSIVSRRENQPTR